MKIAMWIVSILLAAMFVFSGGVKLLRPGEARPMFVHYGYPAWFAIFIGTCEALGAVGLLLRRVAPLAAAGLAIIMAGAFVTHMLHHEYSHAVVPAVLELLLIMVARFRLKELKA